MKQLNLTATMLLLLAFMGCQKEVITNEDQTSAPNSLMMMNPPIITLPAGSHNELAAALLAGNTVILAPGMHTEDNTTIVTGLKQIIGRPGAILVVNTSPTDFVTSPPTAALHFVHSDGSLLKNIQIQSAAAIGGIGVLVDSSANEIIRNCTLDQHQFGIIVEKSPQIKLLNNIVHSSTGWQTGDIPEADGIIIMSGEGALVDGNEATDGLTGIWCCDQNGIYRNNNTHDNYIGLMLCKVPENGFFLPNGSYTGALFSATSWFLQNNTSTNNLNAGYLVIDGSNHNTLRNNAASANGTYDYEIVGDSYRFGFLTPFAFNNRVIASAGQTVKNCGQNSTVSGGILIDNMVDPCN